MSLELLDDVLKVELLVCHLNRQRWSQYHNAVACGPALPIKNSTQTVGRANTLPRCGTDLTPSPPHRVAPSIFPRLCFTAGLVIQLCKFWATEV